MTSTNDIVDGGTVVVVDRTDESSGPVAHGRAAFLDALSEAGAGVERVDFWTETDRDAFLVVGTVEDRPIARLLGNDDHPGEGVIYRWRETGQGTALVVAGTDDRGLMYALLELAERVEARGIEALSVEYPDNEVRGVDRFLETPVEDEWFYDDDFWDYYLDRLARCRFNRFVLITGYDTAFMSPPYPFLVDVPGYPDVRVSDDLDPSRTDHRERLRDIGERCHEHGLEFVFGIWQQQPWTDYQGTLVEGLPTGDDLADYCAAGLEELLVQCESIDCVQLRVNHESGVTDEDGYETAEAFWMRIIDAVAAAEDQRGAEIGLDLRAKGLTDDMIEHGLERGFDVTVPTKFWCESTGLPYHNSRMRAGELANLDDLNRSRRYSYADLLEKPRFFDVLYRLWAVGTNRVFVWGDPEYARRFSHAAGFGDGRGFEITAPLTLKGGYFGLLDERWPLFEDPALRDYEWEDERYWAWYRTFGRLGYAADADADAWEREFENRFGEAADAVERGYRAASRVLPLVTAFNLTDHPALHTWAELDTGGALFAEHNYNERFGETTYLTAEPSDPGLFYGIEGYVSDVLEDDLDGKYTPQQVATWLAFLAGETRDAIEGAERNAPDSGEFRATQLDLHMLADLAEYHAHKIHAAMALCRYRRTGDADRLAGAYASALAMRESWRSLANRGEGTYHDDLVFGRGPAAADAGNWSDRREEIDDDVRELERMLDEEGRTPEEVDPAVPASGSFGPFPNPSYDFVVPGACATDEDLEVSVAVGELNGAKRMTLHYRRANQLEGEFQRIEMERVDGAYRAIVPAEALSPAFDLLVYATAIDDDGDVVVVPGIYDAESPMPYRVVETRAG
ncbi:MAG: hypothetical protein ABEJ55_02635 [Halanaeroarchaeum sp.]